MRAGSESLRTLIRVGKWDNKCSLWLHEERIVRRDQTSCVHNTCTQSFLTLCEGVSTQAGDAVPHAWNVKGDKNKMQGPSDGNRVVESHNLGHLWHHKVKEGIWQARRAFGTNYISIFNTMLLWMQLPKNVGNTVINVCLCMWVCIHTQTFFKHFFFTKKIVLNTSN